MRYTSYMLSKRGKTQDGVGQWVETWQDIQSISVCVSQKLYSSVVNDVVYRKYEPVGITTYKGFEKGIEYKISDNKNTYTIESFNTESRLAQLLLKEVVLNG